MKQMVWIGMFVGSTIGGFLPMVWNGGLFSGLVCSSIGAAVGIIVAYKMST
jgi:uncharacterized membrane protein YeaQ/YmgE (transglycosylase-associated protein family)